MFLNSFLYPSPFELRIATDSYPKSFHQDNRQIILMKSSRRRVRVKQPLLLVSKSPPSANPFIHSTLEYVQLSALMLLTPPFATKALTKQQHYNYQVDPE